MRIGLVLLIGALFACTGASAPSANDDGGTTDASLPLARICDGSDEVRLGAFAVPEPSRIEAPQQMLFDNGALFLYVNGQCQYWVFPGNSFWDDYRTGVLDSSLEEQVSATLAYAQWSNWKGVWTPANSVADGDSYVFMASRRVADAVVCTKSCRGDGPPEALLNAAASLYPLVQSLWDEGTTIGDGGVRFSAAATLTQPFWPHFDWPLSERPLASFAIDTPEEAMSAGYGQASYATGSNADALRKLRSDYLTHPFSQSFAFIPSRDDAGTTYRVYIRPTLPIEDERGLVRDQP